MSVSKEQLQNFSKLIKNHDAFGEILLRVQKNLFDRWLQGNDKERDIVGAISDNQLLWVEELNRVFESINDDKPINDEEGK